jgi:hypothetical protein
MRRCPPEGTRVVFGANPAAMMFYRPSRSVCEPRAGEHGTVTSLPTGRGRATCMGGPAGGLVYVNWDGGCVAGVFRPHLRKEKDGGLLGRARRDRRRRRP